MIEMIKKEELNNFIYPIDDPRGENLNESNFRRTVHECVDCHGTLIYSSHHNEYYCESCGLVQTPETGIKPWGVPKKKKERKKQAPKNPDVHVKRAGRYGFTIHTPEGNCKDLKTVMDKYPVIKNDPRVKQCSVCGEYFIDKSKKNNRKYCSKSCSTQANRDNTLENNFYQRYFVNPHVDWFANLRQRRIEYELLEFKRYSLPHGFVRDDKVYDDNYWGDGESGLTVNPRKNDWLKEHNYITNEIERYNKRKLTEAQRGKDIRRRIYSFRLIPLHSDEELERKFRKFYGTIRLNFYANGVMYIIRYPKRVIRMGDFIPALMNQKYTINYEPPAIRKMPKSIESIPNTQPKPPKYLY